MVTNEKESKPLKKGPTMQIGKHGMELVFPEKEFYEITPPVYLASSHTNCWKCSQNTRVFCLAHKDSDSGIITFVSSLADIPEELSAILKEKAPTYYMDYTRWSENHYYVNHCECGAKLGDFFLHNEPDGPFFIMSEAELDQVAMSDLNLKEAIKIKSGY